MHTLDPFKPKTWDENERAYFAEINTAFSAPAQLLVGNGKPAHAAYLIEKFLTNAEQEVRLFSGCLKREAQGVALYGNPHIHEAMRGFFERNGKLTILLEDDIDVDDGSPGSHPMIVNARAWVDGIDNGKVLKDFLDIRKARRESIESLMKDDFHHHWMVMDQRVFRLETNIDAYKAAVGFGRSEVAKALAVMFDGLFDRAYPLDLTSA